VPSAALVSIYSNPLIGRDLTPLEQIDWSKKNPEWENICIIANSVVSNRQARAATKSFIKAKLGLNLTDGEQRSIERARGVAPVALEL
jgi:DNA sulfur modification protein DndB